MTIDDRDVGQEADQCAARANKQATSADYWNAAQTVKRWHIDCSCLAHHLLLLTIDILVDVRWHAPQDETPLCHCGNIEVGRSGEIATKAAMERDSTAI